MTNPTHYSYSKIMGALAVTFALSAPAQATVIDLTLDAASTSSTTNTSDTATPNIQPSFVSASSNTFENSSFASGSASGNDEGRFRLNGSISGIAATSSSFVQSYDVTNGDTDQFFDFSFNILNGSLSVGCNSGFDDGYGDGYGEFNDGIEFVRIDEVDQPSGNCAPALMSQAFYDASITLNGTTIWDSFAALSFNQDTASIEQSGSQTLGTYNANSDFYSWAEQDFTISLGDEIAANESFSLVYTVTLGASGVNQMGQGIEQGNFLFASSQFGDPNSFNTSSVNTFRNPVNVSTPGTIAILGLGLVGIAGLRKRIQQKR